MEIVLVIVLEILLIIVVARLVLPEEAPQASQSRRQCLTEALQHRGWHVAVEFFRALPTKNSTLTVYVGVPKIRGSFLGRPMRRIIVFCGLYWGRLILGNYPVSPVPTQKRCNLATGT